jgi:type I restriction-modification system DNA methylase subunit
VSKIDESTLNILSQCTVEYQRIRLPDVKLDRKQYEAVNKVLDALGGKWNRQAKAHVFENDIEESFGDVLLTGEIGKKNPLEYFATPPAVVDLMIEFSNLHTGDTVLEPSAGSGAIATRAAEIVGHEWVWTFELDPSRASRLQEVGYFCECGDFLTVDPAAHVPGFTKVLMNPPFSKGQDADHIMHAHRFLEPGGILVAVASAGVEFRTDKRYRALRDLIDLEAAS